MPDIPIKALETAAMSRRKPTAPSHLNAGEYRQLASFRYALRTFLRFSESEAEKAGLSAQQYQALLVVCARGEQFTINDLAQQLLIRHNSAVGLVDRLSEQGLIAREPSPEDRRKVHLRLTAKGDRVLRKLAAVHREELRRIGRQLEALLHEITQGNGTETT